MTIEDLLDAPYIMELLKEHWANEDMGREDPLVLKCLEGQIPIDTIHKAGQLKSLFRYHSNFVRDYSPDYAMLRTGLHEYYKVNFKDRFWQRLKIENESLSLLDLGCGQGYYSLDFLASNPESRATLLDRCGVLRVLQPIVDKYSRLSTIETDWDKDHTWCKGRKEKFDLVLMSEILHQKTPAQRDRLVKIAKSVCTPGGRIVVHETDDPLLTYRLRLLTQRGAAMSIQEVMELMSSHNMCIKNFDYRTARHHHATVWKRIF